MSVDLKVVANLVVGSDGATSKNGSSLGLSVPEDRARFHQIRSQSDAILIGGATARREPYKKTPVPLFILTHSLVRLQPKNQLARQLNMDPVTALSEISKYFEESTDKKQVQLLVEAGPKILQELVTHRKIQTFYLTINHGATGENKINFKDLLSGFELLKSEMIDANEFCVYQLAN
jgi:riboflavin biosynthesis pyrimidine reductase